MGDDAASPSVAAALLATGAATIVPVSGAQAAAPAVPAPCFPRPTTLPSTLYVADVSGRDADEQLLFAALRGIVNRGGPQIYLEGESSDTTSATWLADGVVPMPTQTVSPDELLSRFASSAKGLVVWDANLALDTQNVATTIAGVDDLLPVSPALAATLEASPYGLPVRVDLRKEHFTSRAQAYGWALARFGPPHTHVLAWLGGGRHGLRDLLVACRGFVFQASPETDAPVVKQILDAYPAQTPVFGYPCLDDQLSASSGVPACEPAGVGEISHSGK